MIKSGELNRKISILQKSSKRDPESGALQDTWTPIRSCWASVESQIRAALSETYHSGEFVSVVTSLIKFRWSPTLRVLPEHRISCVESPAITRTFEVNAISNTQQRNEEIVCRCIEIEAKG